MSLKAFHIIFVTVSTLLAFGFSAWAFFKHGSPEGERIHLIMSIASAALGVALVVYGRYFLKKLKRVGYL